MDLGLAPGHGARPWVNAVRRTPNPELQTPNPKQDFTTEAQRRRRWNGFEFGARLIVRALNGELRTVNPRTTKPGTGFHLESLHSHIIFPLFKNAPLAQLAEQVTLNHWVVGSIPTRCTIRINDLGKANL